MKQRALRRRANIAAFLVLLLSLLPATTLSPQVAHAQARSVETPDAPSADASKEVVYVTPDGIIRVLDVYYTDKQVDWRSPTDNWRSIAVGDFNNDGDDEIVAVRGTPGTTTAPELAVFDPVVASGSIIPGQEINGIPWKLLYSTPLPSRPELVFAGDFDPNIPGDEIGIVRATVPEDLPDSGDITTVVIYKQTSPTPDGTSWEVHQTKTFSENWERVSVGNLDKVGGDDVAFVDQDQGKFTIFQPDANFGEVDGPGGSKSAPWKDVTFGQYLRGGNHEALAVRDGNGLTSFVVFEYDSSNVSIDSNTGDKFSPGPRFIFAGDINGNNDDEEAIMLRSCSANCRRLIVRNDGSDKVIQEFIDGLRLDDDNGWRAGVAADIDGDRKAEIVIIRSEKIRLYPDADVSIASVDYDLPTDRQNIFAGDLDRNGYVSGPVFGSTPGQVQETVYFGFKKSDTIKLQNISTVDVIPFVATTDAAWLTVSPTSGTVPGNTSAPLGITYNINAVSLQPGQRYTGTVTFTSTNPGLNVANSPFRVPVVIDVVLPPFSAVPDGVTAFYYPCEEPLTEQSLDMGIIGFPGNKFRAQVLAPVEAAAASALEGNFFLGEETASGLVLTDRTGAQVALPGLGVSAARADSDWESGTPWVTAVTSITDTLPTTLTLTISPTLRTTDFAQTTLLLQSVDPVDGITPIFSTHPIVLACAAHGGWLPIIGKN